MTRVLSAASVNCHRWPHEAISDNTSMTCSTVVMRSCFSHVNDNMQPRAFACVSGIKCRMSLKQTFHMSGPMTLPWGALAVIGDSLAA